MFAPGNNNWLDIDCVCYKCNPSCPAMRICPDCGNKRCPKATWCNQECSNSNEPGQKGSSYGPYEYFPDFLQERMNEQLKYIKELWAR